MFEEQRVEKIWQEDGEAAAVIRGQGDGSWGQVGLVTFPLCAFIVLCIAPSVFSPLPLTPEPQSKMETLSPSAPVQREVTFRPNFYHSDIHPESSISF